MQNPFSTCPRCQSPIPADAPGGICPSCALLAVAEPTDPRAPRTSALLIGHMRAHPHLPRPRNHRSRAARRRQGTALHRPQTVDHRRRRNLSPGRRRAAARAQRRRGESGHPPPAPAFPRSRQSRDRPDRPYARRHRRRTPPPPRRPPHLHTVGLGRKARVLFQFYAKAESTVRVGIFVFLTQDRLAYLLHTSVQRMRSAFHIPNPTRPMHSFFRNFAIGASYIVLAPAGMLPPPGFRITIPARSSTESLGHDFGMLGRDFVRAIERVQHDDQMEFDLKQSA